MISFCRASDNKAQTFRTGQLTAASSADAGLGRPSETMMNLLKLADCNMILLVEASSMAKNHSETDGSILGHHDDDDS